MLLDFLNHNWMKQQKAKDQRTDRRVRQGTNARMFKEFGGKINGGSAWESNPPNGLLTRYTGFEVRESHQCPIHFRSAWQKTTTILISVDLENNYLLYWCALSVYWQNIVRRVRF
jgi:hypothetical protein